MGTRADQSLASEKGRMQRLAEDLRSESSSHVILKRLKAFTLALRNQQKADSRAHIFMQAGGLHTVIHLLTGDALSGATSDATADADSLRSAISTEAGHAVKGLVSLPTGKAELLSDYSAIGSLVDALRDAPSDVGRLAAAHGLMLLAESHPAKRKAVAKAGMMRVLAQCYVEAGDYTWALQPVPAEAVWSLARLLLREEGIARRDLCQAMCGAQADQAFAALVILYDCLATSEQAAPFQDGIVDALVATLNHESPYCAAAAVANLVTLYRIPGSGQAVVGASGAIPALVCVIERGRPPAVAKTGMYGRPKLTVGSNAEAVRSNNPTAMALGALSIMLTNGLAFGSSLEVGGVPALVRLLKEPTCPHTAHLSAMIIAMLMNMDTRPSRLSNRFLKSGLCQAALQALSVETTPVRSKVLSMLWKFCSCLPDQSRPAAVAELVAGNAPELTVGYIAEAGLEFPHPGFSMFRYFSEHPEARQRICGPAVADKLIKCGADWILKTEGPGILLILDTLSPLLDLCPCSIPAAIKANLAPGLVRALCKLQSLPREFEDCKTRAIGHALRCLNKLLRGDMGRTRELWKVLVKAIPTIIKLLRWGDVWITGHSIEVSGLLLARAPKGEAGSWGPGLLRAIAQLLCATPPAPRGTAEKLYAAGLVHPELFVDCRTWGINDGLRRLTMDSDPGTAAAARKLLNKFFLDVPDVKDHPAEGGPVNCSASTSTPPPPGTPGPKLPTRPNPTATSGLDPTPTPSDGRHSTNAGSFASHIEGKLSVAPVLKSPGEYTSRGSASPGRRGVQVVRACARCGRNAEQMILQPDGKDMEKIKLKECSGCKSVRYCGKACQAADWPAHKATCKRLQAARQ